MKTFYDEKYKFKYAFDSKSGMYIRTGILDKNGKDTGIDPFMASFPHLIDVGIMGHCVHGKTGLCAKAGVQCYQSGLFKSEPNMSLENFKRIAKESSGLVNQFALGGRGDPDQHENFKEILEISRKFDIVPNFTTSGFGLTDELINLCKEFCGAVAVSWYRSEYTLSAINRLIDAGVRTNIHYVLGNNSIDEAISHLENDDFPEEINAVIFLLHKPAGQGMVNNVLKFSDPKVRTFFKLLEKPHKFKVGLDSCSVPGVINFCTEIMPESLDTCEGGRFSCYISPDMKMTPCSFDQEKRFYVDLKNSSIKEAWNSEKFEEFRNRMRNSCTACEKRALCFGGCPLMSEVVLCDEKFL